MERMQEAIRCIKQLKELLGPDHFIYRIMADALNERMNSSVEEAFVNDIALDAYVCEAIIECIKNGDHIDTDDIRRKARKDYLDALGIRESFRWNATQDVNVTHDPDAMIPDCDSD